MSRARVTLRVESIELGEVVSNDYFSDNFGIYTRFSNRSNGLAGMAKSCWQLSHGWHD